MILTKVGITKVNLDDLINSYIQKGEHYKFLLIYPTNRRIRHLRKEIIDKTPGSSCQRLNLETLGTFFTRMYSDEQKGNELFISEAASTLLLKQCFEESKLEYFSNYKNSIPQGTLERIRNVIKSYKEKGVMPADLENESRNLKGTEKLKARDIHKVYKLYNQKLQELNIKESPDLLHEVISLTDDEFDLRFRKIFPEVELVVINGFDEFAIPESDLITKTAGVKGISLFISFDYYAYNPAIFSHLDKCYNYLAKCGFREIEDVSPYAGSGFHSLVKEKLFVTKTSSKETRYSDKIYQITAASRDKEVDFIAKEIKELLLSKKCTPGEICVVFNDISKYSSIVRDKFVLYGIPYNLTDRKPLSNSMPATAFMNLLEIAENDYYFRNIFRAFSSKNIEIKHLDLSNLLKVAVNLKITSGFKNWQDSIKTVLMQLQLEPDLYIRNLSISDCRKALIDLNKIDNVLHAFSGRMTEDEFLERLLNLIRNFELPGKLINTGEGDFEDSIRALSVFISTVRDIVGLLKREHDNTNKQNLKYYLNAIRTAASVTRYNIREKPGYGVLITNLDEIRGLNFDYLFIGGNIDGDLPFKYSPEIFYSGSFYKYEQEHMTEQRYRYYQALSSWNKSLYLSHPKKEQRKDFTVSSFHKEFISAFEVKDLDTNKFNNAVYSDEELLLWAGRNYPFDKEDGENDNVVGILEQAEKAIKVNKNRIENPFTETEYTGFIGNDYKFDKTSNEAFSASRLELYSHCPYRYFLERVLKLEVTGEPSEEIEAFELGTMLHTIIYKFYSVLKVKNIKLGGIADEGFEKAANILFEIAENELNQISLAPMSFYEKEKITGIAGNRKNSILYKFLEIERQSDEGFYPWLFEQEFEQSFVYEEGRSNLKIRGKIDRIDINKDKKQYKIIDYKLSGKKPSAEELLNGIKLQLPLYMYAAKQIVKAEFGEEYNTIPAEIFSLKLKQNDFGRVPIKLSKARNQTPEELKSESNEMINICLEAVNRHINNLAEGRFNLSTLQKREQQVCKYCNFRGICRVDEIELPKS